MPHDLSLEPDHAAPKKTSDDAALQTLHLPTSGDLAPGQLDRLRGGHHEAKGPQAHATTQDALTATIAAVAFRISHAATTVKTNSNPTSNPSAAHLQMGAIEQEFLALQKVEIWALANDLSRFKPSTTTAEDLLSVLNGAFQLLVEAATTARVFMSQHNVSQPDAMTRTNYADIERSLNSVYDSRGLSLKHSKMSTPRPATFDSALDTSYDAALGSIDQLTRGATTQPVAVVNAYALDALMTTKEVLRMLPLSSKAKTFGVQAQVLAKATTAAVAAISRGAVSVDMGPLTDSANAIVRVAKP